MNRRRVPPRVPVESNRCSWCLNKRIFTTEDAAEKAATNTRQRLPFRKPAPLHVFACPVGNGYHVAHVPHPKAGAWL